jgi:hypothetical protein
LQVSGTSPVQALLALLRSNLQRQPSDLSNGQIAKVEVQQAALKDVTRKLLISENQLVGRTEIITDPTEMGNVQLPRLAMTSMATDKVNALPRNLGSRAWEASSPDLAPILGPSEFKIHGQPLYINAHATEKFTPTPSDLDDVIEGNVFARSAEPHNTTYSSDADEIMTTSPSIRHLGGVAIIVAIVIAGVVLL